MITNNWFLRGMELIAPLTIEGIAKGGRPRDYLNSIRPKIEEMSREDLEVLALHAVMIAMAGTITVRDIKRAEAIETIRGN